jgi:hypothetical protein
MSTPGSSSRNTLGKASVERDRILNDLSTQWGLVIQPPKDGESPSKRLEKLAIGQKAAYSEECFFKINFLCLKDENALSTALNIFQHAASALQSGWVYKPNAEDDLLPRSPRSKSAVTAAQREQLFHCLLQCITQAFDQAKERQIKIAATRGKFGDVPYPVLTPQHVVERHVTGEQIDDTPIPFRLGDKGRGKRHSDGDEEFTDVSKRAKGFSDDLASQKVIEAVDSVLVVTRQTGIDAWPSVTRSIPIASSSASSAAAPFKVPDIPRHISADDKSERQRGKQPETANTSFTSNTSIISSVFDEDMSDALNESFFSTQTSIMDMSCDRRGTQEGEPPVEMEDTQYGSTVDDFEMISLTSFTPENILRERLQNVFRKYCTFTLANIFRNCI